MIFKIDDDYNHYYEQKRLAYKDSQLQVKIEQFNNERLKNQNVRINKNVAVPPKNKKVPTKFIQYLTKVDDAVVEKFLKNGKKSCTKKEFLKAIKEDMDRLDSFARYMRSLNSKKDFEPIYPVSKIQLRNIFHLIYNKEDLVRAYREWKPAKMALLSNKKPPIA